MASLPLSQPGVDLRFGVHYSVSSESHDRTQHAHMGSQSQPQSQPQSHSAPHSTPHTQHRRSPLTAASASSPASSDSPTSLSTSAPSHQTSFLDSHTHASDSGLASDMSLPRASPSWEVIKREPSVDGVGSAGHGGTGTGGGAGADTGAGACAGVGTVGGANFAPQFPYAPYRATTDMGYATAPRSYYMPVGMHLNSSHRDAIYEHHQRKHVEEQMRRERELAKSRRHVCPVCEKRFNRPSSLNTHMSVHTGAKPYQCQREGCGRRFSVSSNLRRHERTHQAGPRPVKQEPQPQLQLPRTALSYPSVQPTAVYVQAPVPPANITYPYTYSPHTHTPHAHSQTQTQPQTQSASPVSHHAHTQHHHSEHASYHHGNSHFGVGGVAQRYPYSLGASLPSSSARDYHYPSLLHHRNSDPTGLAGVNSFTSSTSGGCGTNNTTGNSNSNINSGNGNGNGNSSAPRSLSATPPQTILMPQPTSSNSLMLG